jgi:hypothetical protein
MPASGNTASCLCCRCGPSDAFGNVISASGNFSSSSPDSSDDDIDELDDALREAVEIRQSGMSSGHYNTGPS